MSVLSGYSPFLADVHQRQLKQFQQCLVAREWSPVPGNFAQAHVRRIIGIDSVENESPRILRRLQPLREWSHEQTKQIFTRSIKERAVRFIQEHRGEYPSLWTEVESIAQKIGCDPATLLEWNKRSQIDNGNLLFRVWY